MLAASAGALAVYDIEEEEEVNLVYTYSLLFFEIPGLDAYVYLK